MKKNNIVIIGIVIAIGLGITSAGVYYYQTNPIPFDFSSLTGRISPEAISSGPLMLDKPQYRIHENIFFIVNGLKEDEKGNIRFFVPDGRLYKTVPYDGSVKTSFNQYFRPDTSYLTEFCVQEEFVGEWLIEFDKKAYPPLKFEIINEHLAGPGNRLDKAC